MLDRLAGVVGDLGALQSKLALLMGPLGAGKTSLLRALSERRGATIFNVGAELVAQLAALPQRQRTLDALDKFRELVEGHAGAPWLIEGLLRSIGRPISAAALQSHPMIFPFLLDPPVAHLVSKNGNLEMRNEGGGGTVVALREVA